MTDKPENPQAFPVPIAVSAAGDTYQAYDGMSLRDYAAIHADLSMHNVFDYNRPRGAGPTKEGTRKNVWRLRYLEADAMLAERAKS